MILLRNDEDEDEHEYNKHNICQMKKSNASTRNDRSMSLSDDDSLIFAMNGGMNFR
jgi:hypothetical protein